ncbi:hypothetical protein NE237_022154 [Protea cynaroides]|uniref:NAD(P)H-hydrate epimerase n=1 Tax=Protea cynaroides TaxID=273540 RepID=A0A9Q0HCM7_9MAGN|nr:hypothetical protein NE237_022154 [Protea cynaroides]
MAGKIASSLESLNDPDSISYLTQKEVAEIDEILLGDLGFSVDQLMELAGLSVATSIAEVYKPNEYSRVLVICGPGNNDGDGLVAARHLHHFGYKPVLYYPNRTLEALHTGLVTQLKSLSIPFLSIENLPMDLSNDFDILVDALFGFSLHGAPRPPFDGLIQKIVCLHSNDRISQKSPVIVSVDVPSGWHVEEGDVNGEGIKPDMLVSLTAPKLCAKSSSEFCEDHLVADPIDQFQKWVDDAVAAGLREPNPMVLSTASKDGKLSSRMVMLKGVDKEGFVWCTDYESRKTREISENPHAALLFYWKGLNHQVKVEGAVQSCLVKNLRSIFIVFLVVLRLQQLLASNWHVLHQEYKELEAKFSDGSLIPKPEHWGGYRLKPVILEFWQGEQSHLHDRLQYSIQEVNGRPVWKIDRLAP